MARCVNSAVPSSPRIINIFLESAIPDIHPPQRGQDFIGAGIVVIGDMLLQLFHLCLCGLVSRVGLLHSA